MMRVLHVMHNVMGRPDGLARAHHRWPVIHHRQTGHDKTKQQEKHR